MKKIEFTKEQYEALLKLVYLGNWLINSHRNLDQIEKKYEEIEQYLFSKSKDFGLDYFSDREESKYPSMDFENDHEINRFRDEAPLKRNRQAP